MPHGGRQHDVLIDKATARLFDSKLEHLDELFERLFAEDGRKVVLFSEWTTMLDLIEKLLKKRGLKFTRLDGSVPQKQRPQLVHTFQTDPECQLFLTTNAGSTGLNLQAANTVINVDLPWNPAVLEQRVARAHRMGQTQPVQVFVLITERTIEENLLATIAAKKDLGLGRAGRRVRSRPSQIWRAGWRSSKAGWKCCWAPGHKLRSTPRSNSEPQAEIEAHASLHRERVAAAGGELLGAAFKFLGELVADKVSTAATGGSPGVEPRGRTERLRRSATPTANIV